MSRNLKALGMALVAVFAIGAVSASAASATTIDHTFLAHGKYLTGVQDETPGVPHSGDQVLGLEGGATVTCQVLTASGKAVPGGGMEEVTEEEGVFGASAATVHPRYNNEEKTCVNSVIGKAQVKTVGCNYLFTGETDANGHAQVHLECEAGKNIEIVSTGCTIHIGEQTLTGIHYVHEEGETTEKALTIEAEAKGIHFTSSGSFCGLAGIPSEGNNGIETANATVTAYSDEAHTEQAGLWTKEIETE